MIHCLSSVENCRAFSHGREHYHQWTGTDSSGKTATRSRYRSNVDVISPIRVGDRCALTSPPSRHPPARPRNRNHRLQILWLTPA